MEIEKIPFRFIIPVWEERRGMVLPCYEPRSDETLPSVLRCPSSEINAYVLGFIDAEKNVMADLMRHENHYELTIRAQAEEMLKRKENLPSFLSLASECDDEDRRVTGLAAYLVSTRCVDDDRDRTAIDNIYRMYFLLDSLEYVMEDDPWNCSPDKEIVDFSAEFLSGKRTSLRRGEVRSEVVTLDPEPPYCENVWYEDSDD